MGSAPPIRAPDRRSDSIGNDRARTASPGGSEPAPPAGATPAVGVGTGRLSRTERLRFEDPPAAAVAVRQPGCLSPFAGGRMLVAHQVPEVGPPRAVPDDPPAGIVRAVVPALGDGDLDAVGDATPVDDAVADGLHVADLDRTRHRGDAILTPRPSRLLARQRVGEHLAVVDAGEVDERAAVLRDHRGPGSVR